MVLLTQTFRDWKPSMSTQVVIATMTPCSNADFMWLCLCQVFRVKCNCFPGGNKNSSSNHRSVSGVRCWVQVGNKVIQYSYGSSFMVRPAIGPQWVHPKCLPFSVGPDLFRLLKSLNICLKGKWRKTSGSVVCPCYLTGIICGNLTQTRRAQHRG